MSGDLYRDGQAFVRHNQQLIAERTGWPKGALETCWELEDRFPGWTVNWVGECTVQGLEHPAGYWAIYRDPTGSHNVEALRVDPGELAEVMADGPPPHDYSVRGCSWCVAHPPPFIAGRRAKL